MTRWVPSAVVAWIVGCLVLPAQTTGLVPLDDLGAGTYGEFQGGLYPGGRNRPPTSHRLAAMARAAEILPRDPSGAVAPDGWIAMLAIGMSNAAHEFAVFERDQDVNVERNARVVLLDTALGGQSAEIIANPDAAYWTIVDGRLAAMGLTREQVQVAWLKEANANPPDDFPGHALALRDDLEAVVGNLHDRFPNLRLCYLSSRTFGGYATIPLNPEPQAYESGFAVQWLIADQVAGKPSLNFDPASGPVRAPLLLWGPYLWADGTNPRSDGLVWLPGDFEEDGTHPSAAGEQKVADLLGAFFERDITARPWWPRQDDAVLVPFDALADASVDESHPSMNFGQAPQLLARGGSSSAWTYLKFDTAAVGALGALAKVGLRVRQSGGGSVLGVDDTSWDESTITHANAPDLGALLAEMPTSSRDGTIAADVTGFVRSDGDGLVSLGLALPQTGQKDYRSKEAAEPPRLVLATPCDLAPDSDGDGRSDLCDCAPADPTLFSRPDEIDNLRWTGPGTLAWDSDATRSGTATVYDLMTGSLADVSFYGTGPDDLCLENDRSTLEAPDSAGPVLPGEGRFYLVRGDNACGSGRYQTATDGRDRATAICP